MLRQLHRSKRTKKGQSTAEFALLIAMVVAFILAMQVYMKRGFQARLRDAMVGLHNRTSGVSYGSTAQPTEQYEPYYLDEETTQSSESVEGRLIDGQNAFDGTSTLSNSTTDALRKTTFDTGALGAKAISNAI